jgi:HPt (histidine-containing phosphotransfer) domain-containing protein
MSLNKEPLADFVFLKKFSKGDTKTIEKYLLIFLRTNPKLVIQLDHQIKLKDWSQVENSAHSLKTQFDFIGFEKGITIARQIRNCIEQKENLDDLSNLLLQLNELCSELYIQISEELKDLDRKSKI